MLRFSFVMSLSLNIEFWSQYDHSLRLDRSHVALPEAWITLSRLERINWFYNRRLSLTAILESVAVHSPKLSSILTVSHLPCHLGLPQQVPEPIRIMQHVAHPSKQRLGLLPTRGAPRPERYFYGNTTNEPFRGLGCSIVTSEVNRYIIGKNPADGWDRSDDTGTCTLLNRICCPFHPSHRSSVIGQSGS
ncbi:hypothetical protein VTN02DRAFT_436 [Thermoascus thermophilus]